jgi:hypothetical protein
MHGIPVDVLQPGGGGVQGGQLINAHGVVQLGGIPTLLPEQNSKFYKMLTAKKEEIATLLDVAKIQLRAVLGTNVVVYRETGYRIYRCSAY